METRTDKKWGEVAVIEPIDVVPEYDEILAVSNLLKNTQIIKGTFIVSSIKTEREECPSEKVCVSFEIPLIGEIGRCFNDLLRESYTRLVIEKSPEFAEKIYLEMKAKKKE